MIFGLCFAEKLSKQLLLIYGIQLTWLMNTRRMKAYRVVCQNVVNMCQIFEVLGGNRLFYLIINILCLTFLAFYA